MPIRWYSVVWDARDVQAQAKWWAEVLDWEVAYEAADEVVILPPHIARAAEQAELHPASVTPEQLMNQSGQGWVFVPVPEGKTVKNRLHIDLAPMEGEDHDEAVQRIVDLGATRVDVGQDDEKVTWAVLADPEGNEFCVLSPRS